MTEKDVLCLVTMKKIDMCQRTPWMQIILRKDFENLWKALKPLRSSPMNWSVNFLESKEQQNASSMLERSGPKNWLTNGLEPKELQWKSLKAMELVCGAREKLWNKRNSSPNECGCCKAY